MLMRRVCRQPFQHGLKIKADQSKFEADLILTLGFCLKHLHFLPKALYRVYKYVPVMTIPKSKIYFKQSFVWCVFIGKCYRHHQNYPKYDPNLSQCFLSFLGMFTVVPGQGKLRRLVLKSDSTLLKIFKDPMYIMKSRRSPLPVTPVTASSEERERGCENACEACEAAWGPWRCPHQKSVLFFKILFK